MSLEIQLHSEPTSAVPPNGSPKLYYHAKIRNNSDKTARNCCVFLYYISVDGTRFEPEPVELKWRGLIQQKLDILPHRERWIDLFNVDKEGRLMVGINHYLVDWEGHIRNHFFEKGENYEMGIMVTSDNLSNPDEVIKFSLTEDGVIFDKA